MTIESGVLEQLYVDEEASYNPTSVGTLVATDGIRHLEATLTGQINDEPSPARRGTRGVADMFFRRNTQDVNISSAMWEPSGTVGTASDLGKLIKGGLGSQHIISSGLVTTVAAAPAPTATGCTLTSVTGLQVGDTIVLTTNAGARREATRIKTLAGSAITYDDLSAAPDSLGAAVSGVSYRPTDNLANSFAAYKYYNAGGFKEAVHGWVVNRIQATFDGSRETMIAFSGPGAEYRNSAAGGGTIQAKPAAHTTVGAPVAGMVGWFFSGTALFRVITAQFTIENNVELRNKEHGTAVATAVAGFTAARVVNVQLSFYLEDLLVMGNANQRVKGSLRMLTGDTNGSMIAIVCPAVRFTRPAIGSNYGPKELTINGRALETSGNDEIFIGEV